MAGGEGTRLRPLTSNAPKPMLPLVNRPMMEHIVALCRRHGFTDVVATVAYLADVIRTYFDDGSDFGVRASFDRQPRDSRVNSDHLPGDLNICPVNVAGRGLS